MDTIPSDEHAGSEFTVLEKRAEDCATVTSATVNPPLSTPSCRLTRVPFSMYGNGCPVMFAGSQSMLQWPRENALVRFGVVGQFCAGRYTATADVGSSAGVTLKVRYTPDDGSGCDRSAREGGVIDVHAIGGDAITARTIVGHTVVFVARTDDAAFCHTNVSVALADPSMRQLTYSGRVTIVAIDHPLPEPKLEADKLNATTPVDRVTLADAVLPDAIRVPLWMMAVALAADDVAMAPSGSANSAGLPASVTVIVLLKTDACVNTNCRVTRSKQMRSLRAPTPL